MENLPEFYPILERELVQHAPHAQYLIYDSETHTQDTTYCYLSTEIGLT
jgi:hypothetical protein